MLGHLSGATRLFPIIGDPWSVASSSLCTQQPYAHY